LHYVIIGNGAAGTQAAETIRKNDPLGEITIISDEPYPAYSRCLLPEYLAGERALEAMHFKSSKFYKKNRIRARLGEKVVSISPEEKELHLEKGEKISYDCLLLATGSSALLPAFPGVEEEGVHLFRSLDDARKIKETARHSRRAVVVGGGFVGLEAAYALYKWGLEVTVIEKEPQILPGQFDAKAASILQNDMQAEGLRIITGNGISEIIGPSRWLRLFGNSGKGVILESGERLKAELVVLATGIRPNTSLAARAGVALNQGIIVDGFLATNLPDVYGAGDVVETIDAVSGRMSLSPIWPNAVVQGRIAGLNMAGKRRLYSKQIGMQNAVEFREVPAMAIGLTQLPPGGEELVVYQPHHGFYKKLILKDDVLLGMILVGDVSQAGVYAALIKNKVSVKSFKHQLLKQDFGYSFLIS
jgi:nitrite reductase (NADH) large subunit